MNFDPVIFHQIFVTNSFKDFQFFGHIFDGSRFVRLNRNLFHGHQFTGRIVNGCVHFAESSLTNLRSVFDKFIIYNLL